MKRIFTAAWANLRIPQKRSKPTVGEEKPYKFFARVFASENTMPALLVTALTSTLHQQTPTLGVIDPRGLLTRTVRYCRSAIGSEAEARIERYAYDSAQRNTAQWDARLGAKAQRGESIAPNLQMVYDLGSKVLASDTVDAGWTVGLFGAAAEKRHTWDSRNSQHTTVYDQWLRPVALFEQAEDGDIRCVERMTYASNDDTGANRRGQLIRHDDPAGTLIFPAFGVAGQALSQVRRFVKSPDDIDWPENETARDERLETDTAYTTTQTYDAVGGQLSQTDARGHTQRQTWTVDGQLKSVWLQISGHDEQQLVSQIDYDAVANPVREVYANQVTHTLEYGSRTQRPRRIKTQRLDGTLLQDSIYAHDPVGNVVRFEDKLEPVKHFANRRTDGVSTYSYDTLDQLITATGRRSAGDDSGPQLPRLLALPGTGDDSVVLPYTHTYRYDAGGNLLEQRQTGSDPYTRTLAVAPNSNRSMVHLEGQPDPDFEAGFDANGNQQFLAPGQPMEWDLRNQLKRVVQVRRTDSIDDDERYIYDANNSRVRKVATTLAKSVMHTAEVRYLPGIEIRSNTATDEALEVITVSAGHASVRVLHWTRNKPDDIPDNQVRYQIGDYVGSVALELDNNGLVISREGYYPFGGTAWHAARSDVEARYKVVRYSGQERDATGLVYYGFRYYAPWLNRWINPDPAGIIDGLNVYRMVRNNPVTLKDIGGLGPFEESSYLSLVQKKLKSDSKLSAAELKKNLIKHHPKAAGVATDIVKAVMSNPANPKAGLEAIRNASASKQATEKKKEKRVKEERAIDIVSDALDYIWASETGFRYIKFGKVPEGRGSMGDKIIADLVGRDEVMFHRQDDLKSKVKELGDLSQKDLSTLFEKKIQNEKTKISVWRGTPFADVAELAELANNGGDYIAGNFLAASTSKKVAESFRGDGVILEMEGEAAHITGIYKNDNEHEYVFSMQAKFKVTEISKNQFKLTQAIRK
ncbi:RHS repeat domain-containing protein [Pseudomonas sp.]|uniref:RHS repeat domain-containing protein n=1 Tax=Pseudomonas sp. TaxID=306 RepID=UPI002612D881|nr:RHS repeat-associated core domain-containing protein [Pseudomonas sp.]